MTEEFVSDIRNRHEHDKMICDNLHFPEHYWRHPMVGQKAHDDRAFLLDEVKKRTRERDDARAEVERQRKQNARLRAQISEYFRKPWTHEVERLTRHRATLRAEVERLNASNERLTRERDEARAEGERLRAWNARLRAQVAEYFREPDTHPVEREE